MTIYDPSIHHRRSTRLHKYAYTQAGAYFVTTCTQGRANTLGHLLDGEMQLSDVGLVVAESWASLADSNSFVELDEWILMPNHLHGILMFSDERKDESPSRNAGTNLEPRRKPLGRVIGAFKTHSTKRVNDLHCTPGQVLWQRSFYEHVIRNEASLGRIRQYVASNAVQWDQDPENSDRMLDK